MIRLGFVLVTIGTVLQLSVGGNWFAVGACAGLLALSWLHQRTARRAQMEAHLYWLAAKHESEQSRAYYADSQRIAADNLAQMQEWSAQGEDRYRP